MVLTLSPSSLARWHRAGVPCWCLTSSIDIHAALWNGAFVERPISMGERRPAIAQCALVDNDSRARRLSEVRMGIRQAIRFGFAPVIVEACATWDADLEALGVPVIYSGSHIEGWNKAALTGLSLRAAVPFLQTLDLGEHVFFFNCRYRWVSPRPSCADMLVRAEGRDGFCTRTPSGEIRTFAYTMRAQNFIAMFLAYDAPRAQAESVNYERDVADFVLTHRLDMAEYDRLDIETTPVDIATGRRSGMSIA